MNDHEKRDGIDPDRAEGSVKKMGGNLKEAAGDRWDDKKNEARRRGRTG